MGAFQSGFQMGQSAWQQALDNKDRAGIRKRQDEEHAWKVEDRTRLAADRTNIDDAIGAFQSQQAGIREGSQGPLNVPMPLGQMGPPASAAPSNVPTGLAPRAPTQLETNQGLMRIATANRDVNAMGTLATQAGTLRIDQKFAEAMKTYKGDPEQIGSTIEYINGNSRSITMGEPDKNGLVRMSVVTPDKKASFIKLTKQDQAQIYAAASIMGDDPTRALAIMSGVNKTMAEAYATENGLTKFLADNSNDVTAKGASMENDKSRLRLDEQRLGLERQRVGIAARAAGAQSKNLKEYVNSQGETVLVDISSLKPGADGVVPLPPGLRPKTTRVAADHAAVITAAEKFVQSGMRDPDDPAQPISMEKAMEVAAAQFSGQPYVSAQQRLVNEYIEKKNGGEKNAPPPATTPGGRGLNTSTAPASHQQRLQQAYDAWQAAKGPWYLPTPQGSAEARRLEQAYTEMLRNPPTR